MEALLSAIESAASSFPAEPRDAWLLTSARFLGLFLVLPFFSSGALHALRFRVLLSGVLAAGLSMALPAGTRTPSLSELSAPEVTTLLGFEALVGATLGWCSRLVLGALRGAGAFISDQVGFSLGGALDPLHAPPEPALRAFHWAFAIHVFISLDFHHACLRAASESVRVMPPGSVRGIEALDRVGGALLASGSGLFEVALTAAFPLTAALLLAALAQGIAARIFPQIEFLLFGFPLRAIIGLGVVAASLPFLAECSSAAFGAAEAAGVRCLEALRG